MARVAADRQSPSTHCAVIKLGVIVSIAEYCPISADIRLAATRHNIDAYRAFGTRCG
jgi:hypothetical protein